MPTSLATIFRSSNQVRASGDVHRLGEQIVQFDHCDTAVAHLVHEVEVIPARVLHPQHVVEEQVIAIGRRQSFVGQTG